MNVPRLRILLLLLLGVTPLVRVFVAGVPLYATDLVLLVLACSFLRPHRLAPCQRRVLGTAALVVASTAPSLLIGLFADAHPLFTLYYYGRRVLAVAAFGTFLVLFSADAALRRRTLRALLLATIVSSVWCVAQVLTRSTGLVGALDHIYYDVLARAVLEPSVNRWGAAWKTPRAVGGWWNANSMGAALTLGLLLTPAVRAWPWGALATSAGWLGLVATGSRQALIGSGVFVAALLGRGGRRSAARRSWMLAACAAGLVAALLIAGAQGARALGAREGSLEEGFASRWNNYPDFWGALAASTPATFLFGRGAESWTVVSRSGTTLEPGAFVSNTLLLTLAENGVLTLLAFLALLARIVTQAEASWQRAGVVVVLWLLNCDNHLYLYPALTVLMWAALALAASPARLESPT